MKKKEKHMATTRFIKVGKQTAGHKALLESKGYEVSESEGVLAITAHEVIEGTVDLSTPEKAAEVLSEVVQKKAVFSYKTVFKFADGRELYGVMACTRLGKASALVTKGEEKKAKKANAISDIFDVM
jgi:hypothetical protein